MTAFKSVLFLLCVPVLLLGLFPLWLMTTTETLFDFGVLRWAAPLFWIAGGVAMLWCFSDFITKGHGTPAPIDPPRHLVASGPYRYVRNPMYVAGVTSLLGHALWWPSLSLIVAPAIFFLATHTFVTLYEEPNLRKKFGASYEQYCRDVPRWIPRF